MGFQNWYERAIYVGGNAKSGTTLLANLLDNFRDINVVPKELPFKPVGILLKPGDKATRTPSELFSLLSRYIEKRFALLKDFPPELVARASNDLQTECEKAAKGIEQNSTIHDVYHSIVEIIGRTYGVLNEETRCWSFKNVHKFTYGLFLEHFPEGKIIHIRRDPRSWLVSRAVSQQRKGRMPGGRRPDLDDSFYVYASLRDWQIFEDYVCDLQRQYSDHRILTVTYERLVADPRRQMEEIGEFIGVAFPDKDPAPSVFKRNVAPDTARHSSLGKSIYREAAVDWPERLHLKARVIAEAMAYKYISSDGHTTVLPRSANSALNIALRSADAAERTRRSLMSRSKVPVFGYRSFGDFQTARPDGKPLPPRVAID